MAYSIQLEHVSKSYLKNTPAEVKAVVDVSLTFEQSHSYAIVGPSGAGKTTLLSLLGGLEKPDTGSLLFDGCPLPYRKDAAMAKFRNETIGFVLQEFGLLEYANVMENVITPAILMGTKRRAATERATQLLDEMGLSQFKKQRVSLLSGGQRQRVAIARALINRPKVILADEPTGSLDSQKSLEVMQALFTSMHEGSLLILVTHNPALARMCNAQVQIHDGRIVATS